MADDEGNGLLSTLYHALRARRRRETIRLLHDADAQVLSVRTLAREIAAIEHELPARYATGEPYRNAYNALSQTHLPTLANAGIIIYDPERQTVSAGPNLRPAALLVATNRPAIETLWRKESAGSDEVP
jgi:hypothetical protein